MSVRGGCAIAVAVVMLMAGTVGWLFDNGYGPMVALRDRPLLTSDQARSRLDDLVRTTMAAITPSPTYCGFRYESDQYPAHWDREPSTLSDLESIVSLCTEVSLAKLPTLLDQVESAWHATVQGPVERDGPMGEAPVFPGSLSAATFDDCFLDLYSAETTPGRTAKVWFTVRAVKVRYQPTRDYKLPGPAPGTSAKVLSDDPYWSH
ncbi:hypothetical protein OG455_25135 [Kitasatospora sp. NBC_01287]|uniref:hypothetical protein n=1 Tax=Kitasatospora sp. NBC_01287 TaxID=2903573 RepID=UPI0022580815|nr:hypothetical protein [Kitasatospora sp. NBC_01287]MCX4748760.1 hypothetical protein [Kitasatospora sp. NBC_01287]